MTFDAQGNARDTCGYCGAVVPLGTLQPHTQATGEHFNVALDMRHRSVPLTSKAIGSRVGYYDPIYKSLPRLETRNACAQCRGVAPTHKLQPRLVKR